VGLEFSEVLLITNNLSGSFCKTARCSDGISSTLHSRPPLIPKPWNSA
jgi:hypothetical protein